MQLVATLLIIAPGILAFRPVHQPVSSTHVTTPETVLPAAALPSAWDWRQVNGTNWLGPIRNHHSPGSCASCWTFATTSSLSDRLRIHSQGRINVLLSAQNLVDCVPGQERCGYPGSCHAAYAFLHTHGIADDTCSPYIGEKRDNCSGLNFCSNCLAEAHGGDCVEPANVTMYSVFAQNTLATVAEIQTEIMRNGPVTCGVHAEALASYTAGIITENPGGDTKDDHALELIGWGTEGITDYWIGQNNWGSFWGESGFFRIVRGKNLAGIETGCDGAMPAIWHGGKPSPAPAPAPHPPPPPPRCAGAMERACAAVKCADMTGGGNCKACVDANKPALDAAGCGWQQEKKFCCAATTARSTAGTAGAA